MLSFNLVLNKWIVAQHQSLGSRSSIFWVHSPMSYLLIHLKINLKEDLISIDLKTNLKTLFTNTTYYYILCIFNACLIL
jgi:hypothetical protein